LALSVLAEFKAIGVLPSLGAYKELTNIYITQNKRSFILLEIIKELVSNSNLLCNDNLFSYSLLGTNITSLIGLTGKAIGPNR